MWEESEPHCGLPSNVGNCQVLKFTVRHVLDQPHCIQWRANCKLMHWLTSCNAGSMLQCQYATKWHVAQLQCCNMHCSTHLPGMHWYACTYYSAELTADRKDLCIEQSCTSSDLLCQLDRVCIGVLAIAACVCDLWQ